MAVDLGIFGNAPPRAAVGYLDPEIAREGLGVRDQKIRMDDSSEGAEIIGEPPLQLAYPDLSKLKPLRKYFNRVGYQVFPSWIYHPNGDSKIVKNAAEAAQHGVEFRATTPDERAAFGVNYRWDYKDTEWRTKPVERKRTVDPDNMEGGKNFISRRDIATSYDQDAMIARTVASVLAALKTTGPSAPANVDQAQWQKFMEFQAYQEATKAVADTAEAPAPVDEEEPLVVHDMQTGEEDPKAKWLAEAERLGVKPDGRWSLSRLIEECQKAA